MQRHADNLKIARWMRNTFPSPYKLSHSAEWIAITAAESPTRKFAIATLPTAADPHGAFIGSIGLMPKADIEQHCMEVGYWVAEPHWGGGIMTEVVRAFTRWAFETNPELLRIDGSCFEGNEGSAKVLTKGGFTYEGMRRNAVYKNGEVMGLKLFGLLREECEGLSTVQAVAAKE
ncbi:acyl-CoA N-acyltransferase [Bombardia bombarda]|uniref:Acyl-CoA N-acyltransferase n=1 Tax=Bombardia bombarda TaxID=252184 RepID=A0AA39WML0_9PEZI|nr:acyl-CoA N-acyltransferase [Bombardia bombarda]